MSSSKPKKSETNPNEAGKKKAWQTNTERIYYFLHCLRTWCRGCRADNYRVHYFKQYHCFIGGRFQISGINHYLRFRR